MARFNFNLRNANSEGETAIHLIIRHKGTRLVYPTGERIHPKFWETEKNKRNFQRAKATKQFPEHPEFNSHLDKILEAAKDEFRRFQIDNEDRVPTKEQLRELLNIALHRTEQPGDIGFYQFIERFIEEGTQRLKSKGRRLDRNSVVNGYRQTYNLLKEFERFKGCHLTFDKIALEFYYDFCKFMEEHKNYSVNNMGKHIKTLKTFLNEATERGINTNTAFRSKRFKVLSEQVDAIYLDEDDLKAVSEINLVSRPALERVRDLFLVGCWTGLRFSDFSNLKPDNIEGDFIHIQTQKTGEQVVIPIHPTVRDILNKYKGKYPNDLPPTVENAPMNRYLKEIAKIHPRFTDTIRVTHTKGGRQRTVSKPRHELISTHTARRSFATNLYKDGFPSISIMKITGHKTETAFLKYIKITPKESAELLKRHWETKRKMRVA